MHQNETSLQTDSIGDAVKQHGDRANSLGQKIQSRMDEARKEAKWFSLPVKGDPLVAPTPENRLLEIEVLLGNWVPVQALTELEKLMPDLLPDLEEIE